MTEPTTVEVEVISEEIIELDRDLRGEVNSAERTFKSAKEDRAESYAALNQFRWEMTECPYGPGFSHRAYAKAVGVASSTIDRGVTAWQSALDASRDSRRDAANHDCDYGNVPHHVPDAAPAEGTGPTQEQTEKHSEGVKKASASELRVLAIEELATRFGIAFDTMRSRTELIQDAMARLGGYEIEGLSVEQVRPTLAAIALEIFQEHKLRQARESSALRWMAKNRAVDVQQIKVADVRKMVNRIERTSERKEMPYDEAEAEVREWDWKGCEAERLSNEMAKKARMAVLDLQQAAARMKLAAINLGKALQKIEADEIPMTDDERELVRSDVEDAWGVVTQARAAVNGDSGVDWDKEWEKLDNKEEDAA